MQTFPTSRFLIPVALILLTNCRLGDLYKRRRLDNPSHDGHADDGQKKQDEDGQVMVGVPILYEQRKYVAKEMGIDPRLIMGNMQDFLLRDSYPEKLTTPGNSDSASLLSGSPLRRKKRGIIWNKIQRVKKGIQRVQKKIVSVGNRIRKLIKGADQSTEKPKYATTAGDGGPKWKGGNNNGVNGGDNGWGSDNGGTPGATGWGQGGNSPGGYASGGSSEGGYQGGGNQGGYAESQGGYSGGNEGGYGNNQGGYSGGGNNQGGYSGGANQVAYGPPPPPSQGGYSTITTPAPQGGYSGGYNSVDNKGAYGAPPPAQAYGPPPPTQAYGPPPTQAYGPPPPAPTQAYGPPPTQGGYSSPENKPAYGPPPPPPTQGGYSSPENKPAYGPPPTQPPTQAYGPPPAQGGYSSPENKGAYGPPPAPTQAYGPPPTQGGYSSPENKPAYGPPPAQGGYSGGSSPPQGGYSGGNQGGYNNPTPPPSGGYSGGGSPGGYSGGTTGGYSGGNNNQGGYNAPSQGGYPASGQPHSRSATSNTAGARGDVGLASVRESEPQTAPSNIDFTGSYSSWARSPTPRHQSSPPTSSFANSYKHTNPTSSKPKVSAVRSSRELEMISQRFDTKSFFSSLLKKRSDSSEGSSSEKAIDEIS